MEFGKETEPWHQVGEGEELERGRERQTPLSYGKSVGWLSWPCNCCLMLLLRTYRKWLASMLVIRVVHQGYSESVLALRETLL